MKPIAAKSPELSVRFPNDNGCANSWLCIKMYANINQGRNVILFKNSIYMSHVLALSVHISLPHRIELPTVLSFPPLKGKMEAYFFSSILSRRTNG